MRIYRIAHASVLIVWNFCVAILVSLNNVIVTVYYTLLFLFSIPFSSSTHIRLWGYVRCIFIYYLFTQWSRVLLEKLTGFQLVKKFPTFCGTRKLITVLTSAHHLSLSWASSIQSMPPHPISWRPISILSSHLRLGLPIGLFPSGFSIKTL